jgi:hypothetical protein
MDAKLLPESNPVGIPVIEVADGIDIAP